jgi:hypothetical protein
MSTTKKKAVKTEDKVLDSVNEEISKEEQATKPVEEVTAPPLEAPSEPQKVTVMSQNDSFVSDLVKEAPKTVAEVASKEQKLHNVLELPDECWALHKKKYRYRWMAKTRNLEAKLRTSIWSLCTRENSPYIKPFRFKAHGAVEQAGMLLAFTTEELGAERENAPAIKSADLVKRYTEDLPNNEAAGFYKPKESDSDDGDSEFEMEY